MLSAAAVSKAAKSKQTAASFMGPRNMGHLSKDVTDQVKNALAASI